MLPTLLVLALYQPTCLLACIETYYKVTFLEVQAAKHTQHVVVVVLNKITWCDEKSVNGIRLHMVHSRAGTVFLPVSDLPTS